MTDPNVVTPRVGKWPLLIFPVLGGILIWLSFWLPWLTWIALVPICLLIRMQGNRWFLYFGCYLGGLAWFLPGLQWIRYSDETAWMGWLALATYVAVYIPIFVFLARVLHRRWHVPLFVTVPVVWTAAEYIRATAFTGFGWMLLAHSVYQWPCTIQIAEVGGVYAVSFLIALVNAFFVECLTLPLVRWNGSKRYFDPDLRWRLVATIVFVTANAFFGSWRISSANFTKGPRVALVQTDLPQSLKHSDPQLTIDQSLSVTYRVPSEGEKAVDLIIWPETSFPHKIGTIEPNLSSAELMASARKKFGPNTLQSWATNDEGRARELRREIEDSDRNLTKLATEKGTPILIGAIRELYTKNNCETYNSSILFAPEAGVVGLYDKIHLVPFGEFVPLYDTLPILRALVPYENVTNGLNSSTEYRSIHFRNLHFASLICFEDTTPYVARNLLRDADSENPIDFLVNQSNDGWFQGSVECELHLAAAVFRCVEGRVPMVRSANMAVTCLIDGNGRILERMPTHAHDSLTVQIPLDGRIGLYIAYGDWLAVGCCSIVGCALMLSFVRQARNIKVSRNAPAKPEVSSGK